MAHTQCDLTSPQLYTTGEAARILGLSDVRVRELIESGDLRAFRTAGGTLYLVDGESLWRLKRERELNPPRRGRPRKVKSPDTGAHGGR